MNIFLTIEHRSKSVPYPPEEHPDSVNMGFQDLKGAGEEAIRSIPEARDSAALREALISLNGLETDFFTVGCEKSLNRRHNKFWKKGYLEFSYNYAEAVSDATFYFALFFHFQKSVEVRNFAAANGVRFNWDLQPARFLRAERDGFTCAVWITAGDYDSATQCESIWDDAMRLITQFLTSCRLAKKANALSPIYGA